MQARNVVPKRSAVRFDLRGGYQQQRGLNGANRNGFDLRQQQPQARSQQSFGGERRGWGGWNRQGGQSQGNWGGRGFSGGGRSSFQSQAQPQPQAQPQRSFGGGGRGNWGGGGHGGGGHHRDR